MMNTCEDTSGFSEAVELADEILNKEAEIPNHTTAREIEAVRRGGDEAEAIYRQLRRDRTSRRMELKRRAMA